MKNKEIKTCLLDDGGKKKRIRTLCTSSTELGQRGTGEDEVSLKMMRNIKYLKRGLMRNESFLCLMKNIGWSAIILIGGSTI